MYAVRTARQQLSRGSGPRVHLPARWILRACMLLEGQPDLNDVSYRDRVPFCVRRLRVEEERFTGRLSSFIPVSFHTRSTPEWSDDGGLGGSLSKYFKKVLCFYFPDCRTARSRDGLRETTV